MKLIKILDSLRLVILKSEAGIDLPTG